LNNTNIGAIGAKRFIFDIRDNNEEKVYNIKEWRRAFKVKTGFNYIGGTMFLARAYPFEKIKTYNPKPEDFKSDGMKTKDYKNFAHILERFFGLIICNENFEIIGQ
jgi:hypothetical protein